MNKGSNRLADPCHETVDPDITEGYAFGKTDFERWGRLWKARASDPELDAEEWVIFLERIQEHFHSNCENFPDEFYFWGDFSGDRTLDLKIAKPRVLTARLLSDLQKYLQMNGRKMWRIRIPIYFTPDDPHRVIVVYPHAMDIPPLRQAAATEHSTTCESAVKNLGAGDVPLRAANAPLSEEVLASVFDVGEPSRFAGL